MPLAITKQNLSFSRLEEQVSQLMLKEKRSMMHGYLEGQHQQFTAPTPCVPEAPIKLGEMHQEIHSVINQGYTMMLLKPNRRPLEIHANGFKPSEREPRDQDSGASRFHDDSVQDECPESEEMRTRGSMNLARGKRLTSDCVDGNLASTLTGPVTGLYSDDNVILPDPELHLPTVFREVHPESTGLINGEGETWKRDAHGAWKAYLPATWCAQDAHGMWKPIKAHVERLKQHLVKAKVVSSISMHVYPASKFPDSHVMSTSRRACV